MLKAEDVWRECMLKAEDEMEHRCIIEIDR